MRVIALRLGVAAIIWSVPLCASDPHTQMLDLFASMASSLTENNAVEFMRNVDPAMAEYGQLERNVSGLVNAAEISSSVELLEEQGDDSRREVSIDWLLEMRSAGSSGPLLRRRENVHCVVARRGKRWRIISLRPLTIFAAPQFSETQ